MAGGDGGQMCGAGLRVPDYRPEEVHGLHRQGPQVQADAQGSDQGAPRSCSSEQDPDTARVPLLGRMTCRFRTPWFQTMLTVQRTCLTSPAGQKE